MKYSVIFKFLAILLCAAMLLTATASGFAIFAMNEAGLYQRSYFDAYNEYRGSILQTTADNIASRYAAQELGGLNEQMLDDFFGGDWHLRQFTFGKMGYVLSDEAGNALHTHLMTGNHPELYALKVFTGPVEYPRIATTLTLEEWNVLNGDAKPKADPYIAVGETAFYDAVPPEGATVTQITVSYGDSSEGVGSPDGLGTIFHNANGHVEFRANMDGILDVSRRSELTSIRFENDVLGLLCEISGPNGVGLLYTPEGGYPIFCSNAPNPDYVPEVMATTAPTIEAPVPQSPAGELPLDAVNFAGANIYDIPSEAGNVVGTLTMEDAALSFRPFLVEGRTWLLCEKGWVLADGAAASAAAGEISAENQITFTEDTPVYSVPNPDSAPLGVLSAGMVVTPIRIVSVNGENWMLIAEGWLRYPGNGMEADLPESSAPAGTVATEPVIEETIPQKSPAIATEPVIEETIPPKSLTIATEPVIEETIPQESPTIATEPVLEETVPAEPRARAVEEAADPLPEYDLRLRYYDTDTQQEMVALCVMAEAPAYTVDFTLAEGALDGDYAWDLLGLAYNFREYLLPGLLGSLLLFALLLVYLCCAAGHRPGTAEIMAGGLNRIPLDGWFILLCTALTGASLLGVEGGRYLMDGSMAVGTVFIAALAYGGSLAVVCFCFACAAQFKTPGGFWWRNSLCGWCIRAAAVCWRWLGRAVHWLVQLLKNHVFPLTLRVLRAGWKFLRAMSVIAWDWLGRLYRWMGRLFRRGGVLLLRFVEQLPMTWQWLLAGFALIILLALTVNTAFGFWGICATIALVLYGAHAFGILLGGVKRMNKGDLDKKVDDKLLIGSFREFAGELNGLADVAVVAAQKQLKSERMKTELITNVSHDIKTPLTSIINYVDLLEKPHTDKEQEVYLEVLSRQSQRLKKLIEDLMDMSKASTGNMAVDIAIVDAVEAVNQALGEFADKLERSDLIPVFRQSGSDIKMRADGRLTWRVLSNLLSNAVKYAQPGTRLYLDVAEMEDKVIISIKNISREELNVSADELLERFVRGDESRNTEGSGLGLNIAQSLMQLQKGSLQLLVDGDLFKVTLIFPAA